MDSVNVGTGLLRWLEALTFARLRFCGHWQLGFHCSEVAGGGGLVGGQRRRDGEFEDGGGQANNEPSRGTNWEGGGLAPGRVDVRYQNTESEQSREAMRIGSNVRCHRI